MVRSILAQIYRYVNDFIFPLPPTLKSHLSKSHLYPVLTVDAIASWGNSSEIEVVVIIETFQKATLAISETHLYNVYS